MIRRCNTANLELELTIREQQDPDDEKGNEGDIVFAGRIKHLGGFLYFMIFRVWVLDGNVMMAASFCVLRVGAKRKLTLDPSYLTIIREKIKSGKH